MKNESQIIKSFDSWNVLKKKVDSQSRKFYVKPREVVWLSLGENVGDEENGKGEVFLRPVLVLKVFNKNIFYGAPLSTKIKENNKYYFKIRITEKKEDVFEVYERSVLMSHCRLFDTKRIVGHIGYAETGDFTKTKATLRDLLF